MSLVLRKVTTYQEVRTYWDLDEVYAMHEILDIRDDLEAQELESIRRKAKLGR